MNSPQTQADQILLPVARIVQGDLYEPNDTDQQGNKLVVKTGPNVGKERVDYFFALAIPKNPGEQVWWQTAWGGQIYRIAMAAWAAWFDPQTGQCKHPRFSWKIVDGDDTTPNPDAEMKRNCDREGFPGHWVVKCSSGFATKVTDEQGNLMLTPGLVKRGFWVEALVTVRSNENAQKPGLYINHNAVAYRAPGKEIAGGLDTRQVGFGKSALPAGVTAQPLPNPTPQGAGVPPMPGAPVAPAALPTLPGVPGLPPAPVGGALPVPGLPPTAVTPNPSFIAPPVPGAAMPGIPAAPAAVPPAPPVAAPTTFICPAGAPAGFKMTNPSPGLYNGFKAAGWTDPQMLAAGHMVKL